MRQKFNENNNINMNIENYDIKIFPIVKIHLFSCEIATL